MTAKKKPNLSSRQIMQASLPKTEADAIGPRKLTRAGVSMLAKRGVEMESVMAYRAVINRLIEWALQGRISTTTAKDLAGVVKTATELLMTEQVLAAQGLMDTAPSVPEDLKDTLRKLQAPEPPPETEVRRLVGTGPQGNPIDQTEVVVTGGRALAEQTALAGVPPAPQIEAEDGAEGDPFT